jgi:EAL domain-containing protein (putative c-di-GMP-specific phosphodiesterase class I)
MPKVKRGGARPGSSNTVATMPSCTAPQTTPRVLFAPRPLPAGRLSGGHAAWQGAHSAAGFHHRPWLGRLRRALDAHALAVHYQPIVSLRDGRIVQHEALVRLAAPGGRMVAPGRFLPAAERYGLIAQIDRAVLEQVLARLALTEDEGMIAVNLSALSVTERGMLAHLESRLAHHGVEPSRLVLEITETAAISDMPRARRFCAGARALGCAVALDDFGAGFGAFHYLKHLPFDHLKIDGAFVRALPSSPHDQLVVQALVGLARGLGATTIAEYVEDARTLELVARYGVDYAQGFHIGPPRPVPAR